MLYTLKCGLKYLLIVLEGEGSTEQQLRGIQPDLRKMEEAESGQDVRGVIVTVEGG